MSNKTTAERIGELCKILLHAQVISTKSEPHEYVYVPLRIPQVVVDLIEDMEQFITSQTGDRLLSAYVMECFSVGVVTLFKEAQKDYDDATEMLKSIKRRIKVLNVEL